MGYQPKGEVSLPPVFISREAVRRLLAGKPSTRQLAARYRAVERLLYDVEHLVRWPALADSLRADIDRLLARIASA